jgi:hypothetical protein
MQQNKKQPFTNEVRYLAGKTQMKIFHSNQYLLWRVAAVKSIRKIILNADDFYKDLLPELVWSCDETYSDVFDERQPDYINQQIRNGWMFEAVAQAEQAIEDVFSLLKNSSDISFFAKNVVNYRASEVKKYIWNFKSEDLEYVLGEFKLPYFLLDEAWKAENVFEEYRNSVLLMQRYIKELIQFHKNYYLDYCQYKHGMSVALLPLGNQKSREEVKREQKKHQDNGFDNNIGSLMTFDNLNVEKRMASSGTMPQMAMYLTPEIMPYVSRLNKEDNLLYYSMHIVDINEVVSITEKAYTLISVLWANLLKRCDITDEDTIHEWVFPQKDYQKQMVVGFPVDKNTK